MVESLPVIINFIFTPLQHANTKFSQSPLSRKSFQEIQSVSEYSLDKMLSSVILTPLLLFTIIIPGQSSSTTTTKGPEEDEFETTGIKLLNEVNIELSKDFGKLLTEANFGSNCDINVLIVTMECQDHLNVVDKSERSKIVLQFDTALSELHAGMQDKWKNTLSRYQRQCKLIFICDMTVRKESTVNPDNDTETTRPMEEKKTKPLDKGFLIFPKLIQSYDHVMFLTYRDDDIGYGNKILNNVLRHIGILLSIQIETMSENSESTFQVFSLCKYCGSGGEEGQNLGNWRRNSTLFTRFFKIFSDREQTSFQNYHGFIVGFSYYPPHISCTKTPISTTMTSMALDQHRCEGVEWEMLKQMSRSLQFSFSLENFTLSRPGQGQVNGNVSELIEAVRNGKIDIALGGITTSTKTDDYTNIFTHQPIVFVVEKRNDLYILGIWLAFSPHVWPVIIFTIMSVAVLIKFLLRPKSISKKIDKKGRTFMEGLEMSMQPLLNQPVTLLPQNPRRMLKLILALWWFTCTVLSTVYNTNLITSLINPLSQTEPETLQDLLDLNFRFLIVGQQSSAVSHLIKNGEQGDKDDDDPLRQIKSRLIDHDQYQHFSRFRIAHILEESQVTAWKVKHGKASTKTLKERLILTGYWWPIKKGGPYRNKLNKAVGGLTAAGLIDHWYSKYKEKKRMKPRFKIQENVKIELKLLSGAFVFLLLGCFLAFIVFLREHIMTRYTFRFFTWEELVLLWSKVVNKVNKELDFKEEVTRVGNTGVLMVAPITPILASTRQRHIMRGQKFIQRRKRPQPDGASHHVYLK